MALPNQWLKAGVGGSYSGYIKPRKAISATSDKQRNRRAAFRKAALECKGKPKAAFRQCMSEKM